MKTCYGVLEKIFLILILCDYVVGLKSRFMDNIAVSPLNTTPDSPSDSSAYYNESNLSETKIVMNVLIINTSSSGPEETLFPKKICDAWGIPCTVLTTTKWIDSVNRHNTIVTRSEPPMFKAGVQKEATIDIGDINSILYNNVRIPQFYAIVLSRYSLNYDGKHGFTPGLSNSNFIKLMEYCRVNKVRLVSLETNPYSDPESLQFVNADGSGTDQNVDLTFNHTSKNLGTLKNSVNIWTKLRVGKINEFIESKNWFTPSILTTGHSSTTTPTFEIDPFLWITPVVLDSLIDIPTDDDIVRWVGAYIKTCEDGREEMHFVITSSDVSLHSYVLADIWLTWVTKGLIAGKRRVMLNTQIDDVFLSTGMYKSPRLTALSQAIPDKEVQFGGDDFKKLAQFTDLINKTLPEKSSFAAEFAFNGSDYFVPCTGRMSYWDMAKKYRDEFNWVSHTMSHIDLDCVNEDCLHYGKTNDYQIRPEITDNINFALSVLFTKEVDNMSLSRRRPPAPTIADNHIREPFNLSVRSMVTPGISGLYSEDAITALTHSHIQYVMGDSSRPQPNAKDPADMVSSSIPSYDGRYVSIIPRFATNIYYNTHTPDEQASRFNDVYGPRCYGYTNASPLIVAPYLCNNDSFKYPRDLLFADIISLEAYNIAKGLLNYRIEPYMFHQPNVSFYSGVITGTKIYRDTCIYCEVVKAVIRTYLTYSTLPVLSLKMDDLGDYYSFSMARKTCNAVSTLVSINYVPTRIETASQHRCIHEITITRTSNPTITRFSASVNTEEYGPDTTKSINLPGNFHTVSIALSTN